MFPLKKRITIRGCQAHINAGLGCGLDVVASVGTTLYAPFDGVIETYWGTQGGNWSRLKRPNGDVIEMAHLSKYIVKSGSVKVGTVIGETGNTGSITTGPHLHIQILRNGTRLDPDRYNWEESVIIPPMTCEQLLEKEKIEHKEDIVQKELNYQNWQTQLSRANTLEDHLATEKEGHKQTLEQLETARAEVTKLEEEMKVNQTKIDQIKGIVL